MNPSMTPVGCRDPWRSPPFSSRHFKTRWRHRRKSKKARNGGAPLQLPLLRDGHFLVANLEKRERCGNRQGKWAREFSGRRRKNLLQGQGCGARRLPFLFRFFLLPNEGTSKSRVGKECLFSCFFRQSLRNKLAPYWLFKRHPIYKHPLYTCVYRKYK